MYIETPACAGAVSLKAGGLKTQHNELTDNIQRVANAIGAGLFILPHPVEMATILRRLDTGRRIWLGITCLASLPPDTAEELAEATLSTLHAGLAEAEVALIDDDDSFDPCAEIGGKARNSWPDGSRITPG